MSAGGVHLPAGGPGHLKGYSESELITPLILVCPHHDGLRSVTPTRKLCGYLGVGVMHSLLPMKIQIHSKYRYSSTEISALSLHLI